MGKLILCSGIRAKRPYTLPVTGARVYSIEELCYYIGEHLYFVDEDFFTDSLFEWMDIELGLTSRGEKLIQLKEQQADIKTLLAALLCSADYYTEAEIKKLIKHIEEFNRMTPVKRRCLRADSCLKDKNYSDAAREYEQILNSDDAQGIIPEEYGDILHNLAVAQVHTIGLSVAAETFHQAYERNQREDSLRQYLYALILNNQAEEFDQKLVEYQVTDELAEDILAGVDQLEREAEVCEEMVKLEQISLLLSEGKQSNYRELVEDMMDKWILDIRQ